MTKTEAKLYIYRHWATFISLADIDIDNCDDKVYEVWNETCEEIAKKLGLGKKFKRHHPINDE